MKIIHVCMYVASTLCKIGPIRSTAVRMRTEPGLPVHDYYNYSTTE